MLYPESFINLAKICISFARKELFMLKNTIFDLYCYVFRPKVMSMCQKCIAFHMLYLVSGLISSNL